MPTYITGDADDVVLASDRNDLILTNGGDDEIRARRGNDVVYAGDGNDFVDGGDGHDVIDGEVGNDEVLGGDGDDTIRGGSGEDTLSGGTGDDDVDGGSGFDQIDGGPGDDRLFGGSEFDVITTGTGSDLVFGGSGSDVILAMAGSAGDRLYGDGYESLDDYLAGRPVTTDFGNDNIGGGAGNDVIYGDSGTNGAVGGDDYLLGGAGDDTIYGEGGNDVIDGGEGRDTLRGGHGDDYLIGGAGADVMTGGAGRDWFTYFDAGESSLLAADRITDFVRGEDRIELAQLPIGTKLAWGGTTPTARGVWYTQLFGQTFVFASVNGDTFPELRIALDGLHNLTPTDFWGVVGDRPPEIFHDSNFVIEDDAGTVGNVLANDFGEADLRVTGVSIGASTGTLGAPLRGQYGSLVFDASGAYTYTLDNSLPAIQALADGQAVFDSFTYTAADAGGSSTAVLGVQIIGRNDAPTAAATSVVTNEGTPATGALPAATDAESHAVTYSLGVQAANGAAIVNSDGSFSYTPNAGFSGVDSFTFIVSDGFASGSNEYTVDVTVVDTNDAPFVANYGVPAGIVHTPIGSGQSNDSAAGMVIQPDGKILLAGSSSPLATGQDFSLARYNADGTFDTTFGNGGIVITPVSFGTTADNGTSVALQSDGKVLVAGWTITGNGVDFALLRYNDNGTLDTTFGGGDGIVTTPIGVGTASDQALHLAVQSDGKIVVVGSTQPNPPTGIPPQQDLAIARYNADGSLDATFGTGGIVITPVSPAQGPDSATAVLSQDDGGLIVAGSAFFGTTTQQDFALVRYTATGDLDLTFGGGDGIVTTAVVPTADSARGLLQQLDGRIVIAGVAFGVPGSTFAIARYNTDGSPDTTFGTGGVVTTAIGTGSSSGTSVAQQADGKLLVAGSTTTISGNDFAIARYNQDGSPDTTFGTNGVVVTSIGPGTSPDTAFAISVQTDGKIVVSGNGLSATGGNFDFALARYNADGSLDGTFRAEQRLVANEGASFSHTVPADRFADPDGDVLTYSATQSDGSALPGWLTFDAATRTFSGVAPWGAADTHVRVTVTDPGGLAAAYTYWIYTNSAPAATAHGFVTTNVAAPSILSDQVNGVALQADGKIVAVGLVTGPTPSSTDIAVARYIADGTLDLGFGGGDGIVTINVSPTGTETARGVVVQADGRIIVAGTTTGIGNDILLSRLNADGTLDTSFGGGDGIVTTPVSPGSDTGNAVTLQADGKILVSGMSAGELTLVRYNTDGSLDTSFDLDGIAIAGTGPANDEGLSVKTQPDGKIVVSGYAAIGAGTAFLLARFNADGSRDASFGTNGLVMTDVTAGPTTIPPFQEAGQALAILPNGRILVVGQAPTATSPSDIALVRYLSDGSLDTSFGAGGIVTTAAGTAQELGFGVALQPDGRIVVAGGNFTPDGGPNIAVLRYNADGTLDTTFGNGGIVTTSIATGLGSEVALSVALQPDGRIVIGGSSFSPNGPTTGGFTNDFTLVRYNSDGSLDTTFGGIGSPTIEVGEAFAWTVPPRAFTDADTDALTYTLALADGSPLPGWLTFNGTTLTGTPPPGTVDFTLHVTATDPWGASATQALAFRVQSTNEAPIVNYAVPAGIVLTPTGPGNSSDTSTGIAVQTDGRILIVGQSSTPETSQDFTVVRYNTDGSLDTAFGGDGIVATPIGTGPASDIANSVALQPDGKILVAGISGSDFGIARYNLDGSLDPTFGGDGIVTTPIGPAFSRDEALSVTVQSDGKIVVAGSAQNSTSFPPPSSLQAMDIAVVRYNADGSLDTSFGGGDGMLTTEIGTGVLADVAHDVLVQSDGGIVIAGYTASTSIPNMITDFALVRYTASGELDTTFGGDGIVTTPIGPATSADQARSILQQPDGRIVVVGYSGPASGGSTDFTLARYNTDGTLDATFGTGGILVHSVSVGLDQATGVVRQDDGKLLVTGRGLSDFVIARYNANGTVDTTFGTNGIVTTSVAPGSGTAIGIALQADGKIVVNGHAQQIVNGSLDFALVRYNADGSLDPTFRAEERVAATEGQPFAYAIPASRFVDPDGDPLVFAAAQTNGSALPSWLSFDAATRTFSGTAPAGSGDVHVRVTATDTAGLSASNVYWIYTNTAPNVVVPSGTVSTNITNQFGASGLDTANAVSIQADGKILLTGSTSVVTDTPVVRLNADGSLDLGFSADGILTVNTTVSGGENGRSIITQPDGRILIASNSGNDLAVTRLLADGLSLDGSFGGGDGVATTNIPGGTVDTGQSVTLQADGKILVTGRTTVGTENQLVLVRHNVDGTLDPTFDGDGIAILPVAMNADEGFSVKTQADGRIVVSGYGATSAMEHSIVVARFNANGSLDTSFDGDGIATTDIGAGQGTIPILPGISFSEAGQSLAIQADGRIVVAGYGPTPAGGTDIALVRYNSDGSLDSTFGTGGVVTTAVSAGTAVDRAFGVALQSDGRIVVAGAVATTTGGGDMAVLRYNVDGTLDSTFGGDGIVTIAIGPGLLPDQATSLAIQADGRIVVAGSTQFALNGSTGTDFAAVRLNSDGSLDTTFGGIGSPVVNAGQSFSWTVQRFIVDADADVLTYTMTRADGSALPAGLTFTPAPQNGAGAALNGTVAPGTGDLALRLTATDPSGARASQYFVLDVNDALAPPDDGHTFVFTDGFGSAAISGFAAGDLSGDVIDLSAMTNPEWTDFADIVARTTQVDAHTLIDLGNGNSIILVGVTAASLTADDFNL
jgi:uncharacterized delta-60 repeat protein